jgi:SAM-dependent methyltransferase
MGLDFDSAAFFRHVRNQGVSFARTLTLGHQQFYMSTTEFGTLLKALGSSADVNADRFADPFFRALGAEKLDVMDASPYEGAGVLHDLNEPIPKELYSNYDCVIDGGTLEHVFNFPTAIKNCLQMVRTGGHFLASTPGDQMLGHGFYQFSPELYFRIFTSMNGYELQELLVVQNGKWYAVPDPDVLRRRVEFGSDGPLLLFLRARRIAETPVFSQWPQQSYYQHAWESGPKTQTGKTAQSTFRQNIRRYAKNGPEISRRLLHFYQRRRDRRERAAQKAQILVPFTLSRSARWEAPRTRHV